MIEKKTYNPMSKEFQDECKSLGLTGNQLIIKYQKEGILIEKGVYKKRCISKKEKKVDSKCINKNKKTNGYYNKNNACDRCGNSFLLEEWNPRKEYDKEKKWTGRWDCSNCFQKYDPNSQRNIVKSMAGLRTKGIDPNCTTAMGNRLEELSCIFYDAKSLNKENDNYNSPIDNWCEIFGCFQTRGSLYNSLDGRWSTGGISGNEWAKEFSYLIFYCMSEDGKIVERIYEIPKSEIIKRTGISITKNPTDRWGNFVVPWYEEYRVRDENKIKRSNDIWIKILERYGLLR